MQKCHEVTTIEGKHKMSLDGRVVIVTGAAGGFGQVIGSSFLEAGAKVVAIDVSNEVLEVIEKQNSTYRKEMLITKAVDISDYFQCQTAVHEAADYFDGVDILVNNAGLGGGQMLSEVEQTQFDRMFTINVRGPFFATQAVVPGMKDRRFGRILNISSLLAVRGSPGNGHYAGAKAALISFVKCWALELGPFGITANAVVPSLTATKMTLDAISQVQLEAEAKENPMGRLGTPDDVANIVAFLASPKASFISGQTISANGASFVGAM